MRSLRFTTGLTTKVAAPFAGAVMALTLGLSAAPAHADTAPAPSPVTAEVCAPGAMTLSRDGSPTVYDGVDCTPGPMAAGSSQVPSATVLRPAQPPAAPPAAPAAVTPTTAAAVPTTALPVVVTAPVSSTSPSHDGIPVAAPAIAVIAAFGAAFGLFQISRRRQLAVATAEGAE